MSVAITRVEIVDEYEVATWLPERGHYLTTVLDDATYARHVAHNRTAIYHGASTVTHRQVRREILTEALIDRVPAE